MDNCTEPNRAACPRLCSDFCNAKEEASARRSAAACSGWVGRLSHDRSRYADWGWLRDEAGELIAIVKVPFMEDEELNEHRRNGTDPAQGRINVILDALYGQNTKIENR
jgi:hypothetical protein